MSEFVIVTDSAADLTAELVEQLGVTVVPLRFTFGEETFEDHPDRREMAIEDFYARTSDISSATIYAFTRGMIPGYGATNGFEIHIQDQKGGSIEDLHMLTKQVIEELNKRPEIARASTSFDT